MSPMITKLLDSLRKPAQRSAADLRQDLAEVDLTKLQAEVGRIEAERKPLLLKGTSEQLRRNEQDLAEARLEVERGGALIEELQRLVVEAEARENAEAFESMASEAAAAEQQLKTICAEIEAGAAKLKSRMAAASVQAAIVTRWNRKAEAVRQPDRRVAFDATALEAMRRRILAAFT